MDGSVTCLSALAFPQLGRPHRFGEAETAAQAWQKVCNLQRSDEVIRFIRAPNDRILTMRELKELAGNEST
jgi:hypothetical protein